MSTGRQDIPGLEGAPPLRPIRRRHALGLPAGSIRALLTALVFGLLATIIVTNHQTDVPTLYNYLWYLLLLIIAHYFAAHGNTIRTHKAEKSPLGLPRGFFRFLFFIGFILLIVWLYYEHQSFAPPSQSSAANPLVLLAGFFAGVGVARLVRWTHGEQGPPFWFQDLQAWIALIAVLVLIVEVCVRLFINPTVPPEKQLFKDGQWEGVFAALVGFYFGARS